MVDTKIPLILARIKTIHEQYPTMRFGEIVQVAIDHKYKSNNNNLLDRSSKQILTSLDEFDTVLKKKRVKKDGKRDKDK